MQIKNNRPHHFHVERSSHDPLDHDGDFTAYLGGVAITRIVRDLAGRWSYFVKRPDGSSDYRKADTLDEATDDLQHEATGASGNVRRSRTRS